MLNEFFRVLLSVGNHTSKALTLGSRVGLCDKNIIKIMKIKISQFLTSQCPSERDTETMRTCLQVSISVYLLKKGGGKHRGSLRIHTYTRKQTAEAYREC